MGADTNQVLLPRQDITATGNSTPIDVSKYGTIEGIIFFNSFADATTRIKLNIESCDEKEPTDANRWVPEFKAPTAFTSLTPVHIPFKITGFQKWLRCAITRENANGNAGVMFTGYY